MQNGAVENITQPIEAVQCFSEKFVHVKIGGLLSHNYQ